MPPHSLLADVFQTSYVLQKIYQVYTSQKNSRANQVKHSSIQTNSHGFLRDTKKEPSTRTPEPALSERDRGGDTGN